MAAPKGNKNAVRSKEWRDTIDWALSNYTASSVKRGQALRAIATKMVEQAIAGDKEARKEIGDRLDGKSTDHKHVTGSIDHEHAELSASLEILNHYLGEGSAGDTETTTTH